MSGGVWKEKLSPKTHNLLTVNSFCLECLYRLVRGKWLTAQMWARYIKNNNHLSDAYLVDAVMLHHAVSYDATLPHVELYGNLNFKGVYRHFVTVNDIYTLHCYKVRKNSEARNDQKVKAGFFWSEHIYNTSTQILGLEENFEKHYDKIDTKYNRTKNTNIKEGSNYVNG